MVTGDMVIMGVRNTKGGSEGNRRPDNLCVLDLGLLLVNLLLFDNRT